MAEYQCSYLDDGRCQSEVTVEAADDGIALLKAEEMLAASAPSFVVMEVRQASRLVGRVTLGTPAELLAGGGSGPRPGRGDLATRSSF